MSEYNNHSTQKKIRRIRTTFVDSYTERRARGFTLIELVVAIAILALMVFGIAELFPRATIAGRTAQLFTGAVNLAQAQMETMLAMDYVSVTTGTFETRHTIVAPFERQTVVEFIDPATLTVRASDLGLKRIITTVYYPTAQGTRSFDLISIIASH